MEGNRFEQEDEEWVCDECNSLLIEERGHYVCPECGLISQNPVYIGIKKKYPRDAPLRDRKKLKRCLHFNPKLSYEEAVFREAKIEVRRLLSYFQIPITKRRETKIYLKFKEVWDSLEKRTKYRNPQKLVPIIFYYYYRYKIFLSQKELLEQTNLTKKEFNSFTIQISRFLPVFPFEVRRLQILKRLLSITETLSLGMRFYHTSAHLLPKFRSLLKAKNDVIAATLSTLAKFALQKESISVNRIASFFQIEMSSIQYQIKKNIVNKYEIQGFTSLVRSKEILSAFLNQRILHRRRRKAPRKKETHKEYRINKYLTLRLKQEKTVLYVNGKKFKQCSYLLLNIEQPDSNQFMKIDSIDMLETYLDTSLEYQPIDTYEITPEQEFWGHCSNIQAWADHDYDTRILHRNLAFPLLKALTNAGDEKAKRVFKEEIAKRFLSGASNVVQYLLVEGYLEYLNSEEISFILTQFAEHKSNIDPFSMVSFFNHVLDLQADNKDEFIFKGS